MPLGLHWEIGSLKVNKSVVLISRTGVLIRIRTGRDHADVEIPSRLLPPELGRQCIAVV